MTKLEAIQKELRHQRVDLQDINRKLMKLLIEKHLQMQVDKYFDDSDGNNIGQHPEDRQDID